MSDDEEGATIDAALREAARDARRLHKASGRPMATWKDGAVAWVQPEDINVDDEEQTVSDLRQSSN